MRPLVKPTADPNKYIVGEGRACTLPNRVNDRPVAVACALPGVIILVHGVNDLGVSYPAQEQGLCQGLNERLWRDDMEAAGYRLPAANRDDKLEDDPDAVYFRRDGKGYSPVIPFYWGYREMEDVVKKNTPHGQYLDRHGNRMDKSGAQGGGPFANATSNLPDMWGGGFKPYGGVINTAAGKPTHPLHGGPDRRYMVLAAMRLAALVQAIRHHDKDETVTLIGHSQGCLLSLTAQAFLDEWGERPADCLILNHPPYGLGEPLLEAAQTLDLQQTTRARLTTLQNLVRVVTDKPHAEPPLSALENSQRWGVCGPFWTAGEARRYEPGKPADAHRTFAERDNRGKVYLYFCPEDLTVGLDNVIGIGSFGVPETITARGTPMSTKLSALPSLGNRFFQRVFTMRKRGEHALPVGASPTTYCLRESGEDFHAYAPSADAANHRHLPDVGETRRITGEPLAPPCTPNLRYGELAAGSLAVDPIDAAVAITNKGIDGIRQEVVDDPAGAQSDRRLYPGIHDPGELRRIEARLNADKEAADRCHLQKAVWVGPGKLQITRNETPNEARLRWQSTQSMENSYHSAIVANPEHSRHVHAFDVAIAQGESVSNPTFRELLVKLADWRVLVSPRQTNPAPLLDHIKTNAFYADLPANVRTLTEANAHYYSDGTLPLEVMPERPPQATVVSETVRDLSRPEHSFTPKRGA
jgi:pimeloyl-ACP methyl ester carboxylesterase